MIMRSFRPGRALRLLAVIAMTGLMSSCSSVPDLSLSGSAQTTSSAASLGAGHEAVAQRFYKLGVGDKLKITVFGEPDLSGNFEVGAVGTVSLPLVGDLKAKGLSLTEFRNNMSRRLSDGYLKEPRITVEVLNYRGFFVHGEVRNGGEFKYKTGLKLRDAIAMAGGYSYRANEGYIFLMREGFTERRKISLPTNMPVLPGDNIRVPERFF